MTIDRTTPPRALALLLPAVIAFAFVVAGCGRGTGSGDSTAKTKQVVGDRVGLAGGTARKNLFSPTVRAAIKKGAPNRKQALADAANASEYVVRSITVAQKAAAKDPKLKALAAKLLAANASIGALTVVLRSGKTPPKSLLDGSLGTIESMENALRDAGVPFKEQVATNLSTT
ncbi:MAG: hypothetical protein AAGC46_09700 [Solirubrobacteraceae bacterium]